jgi:hypothetical protein
VYNFSKYNPDYTLDDIYIGASSDPLTFYMLTYNNIPEIMSNIQIARKVRTKSDMLNDLKKVSDMYEKLTFVDSVRNYNPSRWELPYADYVYAGGIFREIQEYNRSPTLVSNKPSQNKSLSLTGQFQLQHHAYYNMMLQENIRMFKLFAGNYNIVQTMNTVQMYYIIKAKIEAIRKLNNASIHQTNKSFWSNNIKIDDAYQKIINKIDDIFPEDSF